ncbi:MAG: CRISPR-associated endoribonuclease Cas6 [Rhabdochlamydiaceae bacterium]
MRILLSIKSLQDYQINFEYHHKVQGFIYSLLRNTKFDHLHDKQGFKFFCFSNIYKAKDANHHSLIISSPDQDFITQVEYQLNKIIENQIPIELGSLFELIKIVKIPQKNLSFPLKIITQSPIIIRIPIEKYQGRVTDTAPYKEIFWRKDHPADLFINAMEKNLKKKFAEFSKKTFKGRIIEKFDFKKQVSTKIYVANSKVPVIGSLWRLDFSSEVPRDIQLFALDCGLGERNSIGFGFVNPIIEKNSI